MNVALRIPRMTRAFFLDWAETQNERYEFDGFEPVAMVGGTINHGLICHNLWAALRGSPCRPLGPDSALATIGDAIHYPDALVSCTKVEGTARLVPGVVVVFEVLSPTSGRADRIDKVREYHAVPTIRRYVIFEHETVALTVLQRDQPQELWHATALTADDILRMPEIGIEIPIAEFYQDVEFPRIGAPATA